MLRKFVQQTVSLARNLVSVPERRKFVDRVRVQVNGGIGGSGVVAYEDAWRGKRRAAGGSGGHGGDVYVKAVDGKEDLSMSEFVYNGGAGTSGQGQGKSGRRGKQSVIRVPVGTIVKEVERTFVLEEDFEEEMEVGDESPSLFAARRRDENGVEIRESSAPKSLGLHGSARVVDRLTPVADLSRVGDQILVARGGRGGAGNIELGAEGVAALKDEERHTTGTRGETRFLELELRALADVALVGYPNAGKSTLLRSLSRARPRVAAFPFTTLRPVIGSVRFEDGSTLRVADIPGLIEGAHRDRGLGHEFLRHIERTRVIVYVIDAVGPASTVLDAQHSTESLEAIEQSVLETAKDADLSPEAAKVLARLASESNNNHPHHKISNPQNNPLDTEVENDPAAGDRNLAQRGLSQGPVQDFRALQRELSRYDPLLPRRPSIIVANKCDLPGAEKGVQLLRKASVLPVLAVSGKTKDGAQLLAESIRWLAKN